MNKIIHFPYSHLHWVWLWKECGRNLGKKERRRKDKALVTSGGMEIFISSLFGPLKLNSFSKSSMPSSSSSPSTLAHPSKLNIHPVSRETKGVYLSLTLPWLIEFWIFYEQMLVVSDVSSFFTFELGLLHPSFPRQTLMPLNSTLMSLNSYCLS